jgi:hypothetical protein
VKRVFALSLAAITLSTAADFAILNLRVVEGEGTVYSIGARATRGITVEVTDEAGHPVADVAVSFRMPEEGPSGVFSTGSRTEVITTRQDGRAAVWGMHWNRTLGPVQIRITAAKQGVRAGIVSTQYLSEASAASTASGTGIGRGSHTKLILIAVAAVAAAGGGVAAMASKTSPAAAATPSSVALSIGRPSVIVGAP